MDNRILTRQPLQRTQRVQQQSSQLKTKDAKKQVSFSEVLTARLNEKSKVDFSKHARDRLLARGIEVSEKDLSQLEDGLAKAAEKGSRESLIMVNQVAYVVSVENKTVITAIDDQNLKENVFTNIDSAVFM